MTLLTIEKDHLFTIKTAELSTEDHAVLVDILEHIHERVLDIERHYERLWKPPFDASMVPVLHAVEDLTRIEGGRCDHSLPYPPREPLTSLRTLASCLVEAATGALASNIKEARILQEASHRMLERLDKLLSTSHYMPHDEELLTLDSQIFAACKRICNGLEQKSLNVPSLHSGT